MIFKSENASKKLRKELAKYSIAAGKCEKTLSGSQKICFDISENSDMKKTMQMTINSNSHVSIELKSMEKLPKDFSKIIEKLAYQLEVPSCSMLFDPNTDSK